MWERLYRISRAIESAISCPSATVSVGDAAHDLGGEFTVLNGGKLERKGTTPAALADLAVGGYDVVVRQNGRVQHVIVSGKIVVTDGKLATHDFDSLVTQAEKQAARLWKRMAEI